MSSGFVCGRLTYVGMTFSIECLANTTRNVNTIGSIQESQPPELFPHTKFSFASYSGIGAESMSWQNPGLIEANAVWQTRVAWA